MPWRKSKIFQFLIFNFRKASTPSGAYSTPGVPYQRDMASVLFIGERHWRLKLRNSRRSGWMIVTLLSLKIYRRRKATAKQPPPKGRASILQNHLWQLSRHSTCTRRKFITERTAIRRIGFRTVEVKGTQFLINGELFISSAFHKAGVGDFFFGA